MTLPLLLLAAALAQAQDTPKLAPATLKKLRLCTADLSAAQNAEDLAEVRRVTKQAVELLGDQAGLPEVADVFRPVPRDVKPLAADELPAAFDPYLDRLDRVRWWKVGLDPTKTPHAAREVATVLDGCLAARSAIPARAKQFLAIATEAGDYLVWSQDQAGTGVIPFPAVRDGSGRPFEVAERFYRQAEKDGKLATVIRNGWAVEDLDDGGLQFDNGVGGVALVRLYEATRDEKYLKAARRAGDWAVGRRVVTNWNYNSFSVYLLAELHRVTKEKAYLDAAKKKARLGLLPGQLTDGPRKGRWADAHNARPAYHYIMIRALASLAQALPPDDAELPATLEALRLALAARNPEYRTRGVANADTAIEALALVERLPPHAAGKLAGCDTAEALAALERYAVAGFRAKKMAVGIGAWGQLLARRAGRK